MPAPGGNFQVWGMRLIVFCSLLLSSVIVSAQVAQVTPAKLRTAKVDIQTIFASYSRTLQAAQEVNNERAYIEKQSQLARAQIAKLEKVKSEMEVKYKERSLPSEEKARIRREGPILIRDIARLTDKQQSDWDAANQRLNYQMVSRMNRILADLQQSAAIFAKERGYDLLYDSSGKNTSQVAPILFAKEGDDLTESFMESLVEK